MPCENECATSECHCGPWGSPSRRVVRMLHADIGHNHVSLTWGTDKMFHNQAIKYCATIGKLSPDLHGSPAVWKETHQLHKNNYSGERTRVRGRVYLEFLFLFLRRLSRCISVIIKSCFKFVLGEGGLLCHLF